MPMQIPEEWREAIIIKIQQRYKVTSEQAILWLDDVLREGHESPSWNIVRPAALEFIKPVWDALSPAIKEMTRTLGVTITNYAEAITAEAEAERYHYMVGPDDDADV